ncbi:MAG TPA: ABC transporter substrate-binding protein [Fervidobacterium sp.]|nr:ABC transporter substrate-binding protein [Fervidobacterium sp.]
MKRLVSILVLLVLAVSIFAEVGVYSNKVVIGSFQAMSGPYAVIGQEMTKGMKAYFNWINKRGGVYGRKIELIVADDQLNPAKTVVEVKRLVEQDKVFALVGGLGTYGCLAVMDYVEQNKVPFVYQGSGASQLVLPPKKYIFAVQPDYTLEGALIAKYVAEIAKFKNPAIVYMNNDVGLEGYAAFKQELAKYKMTPSVEISYNPADTDYSGLVIRLVDKNPDVVVVYGLLTDTVRWVKTIKDYGLNSKIITTYANADPSFMTLAGKYAEGVIFTGWVPLATPDRPEFVRDYQRAVSIYQETYAKEIPSSYAVAGFIAAEVFTEGLVRAGKNLTREGLVKALESFNNWNGILSKDITWGPNLRRGKSSLYFLAIKGNQFVPLTDLIQYK